MQENEEINTNQPRTRTTFQPVLNQEFFFGSRVVVFLRDLSHLKYWLLRPFFLQRTHMQKQYLKELLYAAKTVPSKDYFTHLTLKKCKKGTLSDHPRLSPVSSLALLCCWGRSCSKIWRPPAAKHFLVRKARTIALSKAQESCHKTSNNQPYSRVWKSLGDSIPKLYCVA